MLTLPSLWNVVISIIVFFIAVWYLRRLLDEYEFPKGITRGVLVFVLAYAAAVVAAMAVDWVSDKITGKADVQQAQAKSAEELKQMLDGLQALQQQAN